MSEKIEEHSSEHMYLQDMVQYSIIVDRRRALPDIRDGLKPVQRRVLYDMLLQGAYGHTVKSAKIVGDTMGQFHAHGDSSIYTCIVPLANWYSCKVPLVKGQGNLGSIMGDGAAAMRYTEVSLSDFGYDCVLGELKTSKYIVDWKENFDRTTIEPEFLPCKVPLLLINGTFGIGVGLAVNIPPHNLVEVLEATRALIKNPNADIVLVPDHCQPLKIVDSDWRKISHTGEGKYKVRGQVDISQDKNGYPILTIRSLPDNISTGMVSAKLMDMIDKKQLPMIKDINDASKKEIDFRIVLKKGADPYYVKEILYTKAGVQDTVAVNFQAVDDINPGRFSYKKYLQSFINQRATVKFRLYCNKLKVAATRAHKLEAYIKVIESGQIDKVVDMVRKQKTKDNAVLVEFLIKMCHITDLQANYILCTTIQQLSQGNLNMYKAEYSQLEKDMAVYNKAVTDDGSIIMNEIDQELVDIENKYGQPRVCKVVKDSDDNNIPKGIFKIVITERNYIRKVPDTDKVGIVRKDNPKFILRVDNTENILLFDSKGKVFKLPVYKIPVTDRNECGTDIRILSRNLTANIIAAYYEPAIKRVVEGGRKHHIVVLTKYNTIKKLDMEDFLNVNLSGLMYSKIKDDDEVVGIAIVPDNLDIMIYSNQKALRIHMSEIPLFKRNASGSKAMNTTELLEGISVIYPDAESALIITTSGKMNKFPINGITAHGRARSGNNVVKLADGDTIFSILGVNESDNVRVVTSEGTVEVPINNIKMKSSIASGQRISDIKGIMVRCDIIR